MAIPPTPQQLERSARLARLRKQLASWVPGRSGAAAAALIRDGEADVLAWALRSDHGAPAVRKQLVRAVAEPTGAAIALRVFLAVGDATLGAALRDAGLPAELPADLRVAAEVWQGRGSGLAADAETMASLIGLASKGSHPMAEPARAAASSLATHCDEHVARVLARRARGDSAASRCAGELVGLLEEPAARGAVTAYYVHGAWQGVAEALQAWGMAPTSGPLAAVHAALSGGHVDPAAFAEAVPTLSAWQRARLARRATVDGNTSWAEAALRCGSPLVPLEWCALSRLDVSDEVAAEAARRAPAALVAAFAHRGPSRAPWMALLTACTEPPLGGLRQVVSMPLPDCDRVRRAAVSDDGRLVVAHLGKMAWPGPLVTWQVDVASGTGVEMALGGDHAAVPAVTGDRMYAAHRHAVHCPAQGDAEALHFDGTRDRRGAIHGVWLGAKSRLLAAASNDPVLRVWDADTAELLREIDPQAAATGPEFPQAPAFGGARTTDRVLAVATDEAGQVVAACVGDGTLRAWSMETGMLLMEQRAMGYALAVSADGSRVTALCGDGAARVFAIPGGALVAQHDFDAAADAPLVAGSSRWSGGWVSPDAAWAVDARGGVYSLRSGGRLGAVWLGAEAVAGCHTGRFLVAVTRTAAVLYESEVARLAWTEPHALSEQDVVSARRLLDESEPGGGSLVGPPTQVFDSDRPWLRLICERGRG